MNIQTNIATILFIIIPSLVGFSQEKPTSSWNLKDCIDYARKNNIQVEAYSPIAHGEALKNPAIVKMAEKYGVSAAQLCIRYAIQLGTQR